MAAENTKEYSRWIQRGQHTFIPSDNVLVIEHLPPGLYNVYFRETYEGSTIVLTKVKVDCSHLLDLHQPEEEYIHKVIDNFCSKKEKFRELKIAYKTGILLYGVQGSGKTSILSSIIDKITALDGIAFLLKNTGDLYSFDKFYKTVYRKVEPTRLIMNVFEDIDGMTGGDAETTLINILDGIGDCENVINLATTNFTEKLSERIVNRPGRFDRRIEIKSPSPENRKKYFLLRIPESYREGINIDYWVKKTENFTLAQLNEVVKSVLLLDEKFEEVVEKIRNMCNIPHSRNYNKEAKAQLGFRKSNQNGEEYAEPSHT